MNLGHRALASLVTLMLAACSSSPTTPLEGSVATSGGGGYAQGGAGQGGGAAGGGAGQGGGAATGAAGGAAVGGAGHGGSAAGGSGHGGAGTAGAGGGVPTDPVEAARVTCVAKINALRATKGLTPYQRWNAAEKCVDAEVTSDEAAGQPHAAFIGGQTCGANGQDECLGHGISGIEACLDQMWAEKDLPGCAGCDACAGAYDPNCPDCDFSGQVTGQECGHYVNMSAKFFSRVACGFNAGGTWDAQNFQ